MTFRSRFAREVATSAKSQPVPSIITVVILAAAIVTTMLTSGRAIGAEQEILATIDSEGTRSIVIRAQDNAGVSSDVVARIGQIEGIEWFAAFSTPVDGANALNRDGASVPVRRAFGPPGQTGWPPPSSGAGAPFAYASRSALDVLGLGQAGSIQTQDGDEFTLAGEIEAEGPLATLEPLVVVPVGPESPPEPVSLLIVVADDPSLVDAVAFAVLSVLWPDDASTVSVETSADLANLRAIIEQQLAEFSRGSIVVAFGITACVNSVLLFGLVLMRRRDFGRRRALGASRGLIFGLLVLQTAILSVLGIAVGIVAALMLLAATSAPTPGLQFLIASALLAFLAAVGSALLPALFASTRQPIYELRVP